MPRFKLTLEYDGAPFAGWQRQDSDLSVQEALEAAVYGFCGERTTVVGAGRTDAGVHALGQVAHVDLSRSVEARTLMNAVNAHLRPRPIAVLAVNVVDDAFHARFSAVARHYRYRIINRRAPLTLDAGRALLVPQALNAARMHEAAQMLVGRHDFTTFRSSECQSKSPVKTLDRLDVRRLGEEIVIEASARSFLHHQVRSMVGSLLQVGLGKWSPADLGAALAARNRTACGPVVAPDGLYLVAVDYPPAKSEESRWRGREEAR